MLRLKFLTPNLLSPLSCIFVCSLIASASNIPLTLLIKEIKENQRNQNYNESDKLGREQPCPTNNLHLT